MKFTRVDLVLLSMVLVWGANLSVIKVAMRQFDPMAFNCLRFVIASLTMLVLYRDVFKDPVNRKELLHLLVLGLLGNTVYQWFFINGVHHTQVSHASILLGTSPVFTAAISNYMGFENVGKRLWLGIILSFVGIVFIVFGEGNLELKSLRGNIGDLFILASSLSWSIYTTFSKRIVSEYSSRHYILYTVLFGTVFLVPISLPGLFKQNWAALGVFEWTALFYSSLLALVFGFSAWYYGVQKIGSTRTSIYANLTPVAGLMIGMVFLGERLSLLQWIGASVIFLGLILNRLSKSPTLQDVDAKIMDLSLTK